MPSRYMAHFPERKITAPKPSQGSPRGPKPSTAMPEKTAAWSDPGSHGPADLNRATKMPVLKTTPKKAGLP